MSFSFLPSLVFDPKKIYLGRMSKNNMTGPTIAASLELEKNTLELDFDTIDDVS